LSAHDDLADLFERLGRSRFRSRFRLRDDELRQLARLDRSRLAEQAAEIIRTRLAAAEPRNDGKQTPWRGHPVFVAQHATATCCRGCLAKWHGIAMGSELTTPEQDYVVSVLLRWIEPYRQLAPPTAVDPQLRLFDES
jgi:hypothetical protein